MVYSRHLALGNAQRHDFPFPGRILAALNQRLVLSCFSVFQCIPARHED